MSTVVDVASSGDDEDADGESTRDVFGESAIEVDDETLRRVSPGAWGGASPSASTISVADLFTADRGTGGFALTTSSRDTSSRTAVSPPWRR